MKILVCDAGIQEVLEVKNGNIKRILALEMKGGGGTDHRPIFEWIAENAKNARLVICFTDGETAFPDKPRINTLWIVTKNGNEHIPFGNVIKMR